ncbi:MAG: AAA family ATPase [Patescibacteria group bacterium]
MENIPTIIDTQTSEEIPKTKPEKIKFGKLGIALEVAEDRGNARDPKEYEDDFKIPTIEWMEGEIAMAFRENEPILIEGGTGIGKTRTVERMCALLGYELYKLPCSSSTTEREMMGRYVSNPNRKSDTDPEVIFALGVVAEALKEESGKIKVIYLDEINAIEGAVGARLHDILDEVKKEKVKGQVKLVEDAGEILEFDSKKVKIVATMNSADSKNTHAQRLSEALLRRFTYKRTVDELPDVEFLSIALQKFQSSEILKDLPGITDDGELIKAYSECHKALQGLKRNNRIGVGVAQDFKFEDIDYLKRVIKKVSVFWEDGIFTNLPEAFQEAVKIIYTGMIVDSTERAMMEEQIAKLDFKPPEDSNRKGLKDRKKKEGVKPKSVEGSKEKIEAEKLLEKTEAEIKAMKVALRKSKKEFLGETFESTISAEYIYKDEKGKEVKEIIEIDFTEKLDLAMEFYKKHSLEIPVDFEERMQTIWEENRMAMQEQIEEFGFDKLLIIPGNIKLDDAFDKEMTKGYKKKDGTVGEPTYWGVKKTEIVSDARSSKNRLILVHKNNAINLYDSKETLPLLKETLGKKAGSFKVEEGMTIEEYAILQRVFFEETGEHLDEKGATWLPRSKVGAQVVYAYWNPDSGRLGVDASALGYSNPVIGCRPSRCFL